MIINGGADVHGAAVDTDEEPSFTDEMDQLQQRGLITEIDAIVGRGKTAPAHADNNNARRGEVATEPCDDFVRERFAPATGVGMEQDEWIVMLEAWQRIAGRKRETQWTFDVHTKSFRKLEITFDRMSATIHVCDAVVGKSRALAGIAHSENFTCATDARDERTAQQSLKIEGGIRFQLPRFFYPAQQIGRNTKSSAQFVARKNVNVINIAIAAQKRRPFWINDPPDSRGWIRLTNGGDGWQRMDYVA